MRKRSEKYKYKEVKFKSDLPKPKRGEVAIVPMDNRVFEFLPYVGMNSLPEWWKNLNKGKGSIRRCQGTYDYVTNGFILPLWTNLTVRPNANGTQYETKMDHIDPMFRFSVEGFNAESAKGCPIEHHKSLEEGQYIKLVTPWRFITPKNVSIMTLPVLFEPDPRYSVVPGIVHTDFYHQINVVINVHTTEEFTIPAGTPILHMIPIKRNENTKNILWGNESMYKFVAHSGLGENGLVYDDKSTIYRKLQRRSDQDFEEEKGNKKWFNFFKK